ncbi:MAG TPA: MarR family winged helix-turn-helix transcriptional regulator [Solirubrobacteraceae bacterium]
MTTVKSQRGPASTSAPDPAWEAAFVELGSALRTMVRGISRRRGRDTHLGDSEISHAQFELLIELCEHGEMAAGELAAAAHLTPATVTQMLDHLADCGHVERARSVVDRRVVVTRLTPEGERLMLAKREIWRTLWEAALGDFSTKEMLTAARVLQRLGAVFEEQKESGEVAKTEAGEAALSA